VYVSHYAVSLVSKNLICDLILHVLVVSEIAATDLQTR